MGSFTRVLQQGTGEPGKGGSVVSSCPRRGQSGEISVVPSVDLATDARRAPVTEPTVSVPQIIEATEKGQVEDLKEDFGSMQARGFLRLAPVIIDTAFTLTRLIPDQLVSAEHRCPAGRTRWKFLIL